MTGTTASTLGSLHEAESEQAIGRSASSSVCEYAGALGRDTSLFCEMSSVQSSSAAERAKFALVGPANGCSRGANESMSEILVTSNTPPFGEDYGDHRECTLDALTLNEVSGAAVPVTLHTHLPGDPCPAHSPVADGTRDRPMSKYADVVLCRKQDWPRGRRVDSRTTHAAMNSKSQAFCLFCEYFSAQVHSLYTPKECTTCATRCTWSCSGAHVSSATDRRPSMLDTTTATLRSRSLAPLAVPSSASTAACLRLIFSLLLTRRSVRSAIVAFGK